MKRQTRWLATALALVLASAVAVSAARYSAEGSFERTLTVTGAVKLEVQTGSGSIQVRTGEPGRVQVKATIRARADDENTAEEKVRELEANPPIDQDGNLIRIGRIEEKWLKKNVSISYELVVPADTSLKSATGSGSQEISGVRGPVRVTTGSGNITLSEIGDEVRATTGSGNIEIGSVAGDVRATTGSGSITAGAVGGAFEATTGSGSVRVTQTVAADIEVQTGSGGVRVALPAEGGYDLYARTGSGSIETDFSITVQGTIRRNRLRGVIRGGGHTLRLRTGSGSIHIE